MTSATSSTRSWYKTARWKHLRAAQLKREPNCRMCKEHGQTTQATVADHIVPHKGDSRLFWSGQLQSLCATHHNGAKQQYEKSGTMRGCDENGWPLSREHEWHTRKD